MNEHRVTQAGIETALAGDGTKPAVTQAGLEVLVNEFRGAEVTQAGLEVLLPGIAGAWDDPVAAPRAILEIDWTNDGAWVDETGWLLLDGGLDVKRSMIDPLRGLASMGSAPLGTATFRLRNDDGRYSKTKTGSQAATYGLHGLPIRASLGYAGSYETVFRGRIVDPRHTEAGETAVLQCRDEGETLLRQTVSRQMNPGAQSGDLIATYATEGGLTAVNGIDVQLDKGLFVIPYAYLENDNLWQEIQKVAASEGGVVFIDREGKLVFWSADHFLDLTPAYTFDESLYAECALAYDYQNKYNVVTAHYTPREAGRNATAHSLSRPLHVGPGETRTETLVFRWPLASFDSYEITAVTGGGRDISSDVSIDPTTPQNAQSWTVTFTNANAIQAAYIMRFDVIGQPAEGRPSETYTVDPGDVAGTKDARDLDLQGSFYMQTHGQASMVANMLADRLATEVLTMRLVDCPALPLLDLGERITVQASNTEIDREAIVTGLHFTFGPAAKMTVDCVDATNLYGESSGYFQVGTSALGTGKLFY